MEELELIKKDLSDIKGKLMAIDAAAYLALSNIEKLEVPESVDRKINKKVIETAIMIQSKGDKNAKATKESSES